MSKVKKADKLTSTQMANLISIMAVRQGPERGALGVRGVKVFVQWVLGYAPPHRNAAIIIVGDMLKADKSLLSTGWIEEATDRMAICLDPTELNVVIPGSIGPNADGVSQEDADIAGIQEWAAQADVDDEPDEDDNSVDLNEGGQSSEVGEFPDFGAMHDGEHGKSEHAGGLINADANPEPTKEGSET